MSIKTFSQMQNTLKSYDMNNWSKSVEIGKELNFKDSTFSEASEAKGSGTFGDFLANSIAKVNNLQHEANTAMEKLASGKSKNLHETLLTVEKAEIAFKTMNQVRTKVIDAYKEIMKMQI
ncbi:MAG: flagellar hook-basal body complex protein FliE [Bacteriovoracaceae bacterium]|jgi:flagellar hook-basal body complex protein FliE|nr:flagellar hook-basal body complex protein FliE [Bacteriovoracaceae bacterium]